MFLLYKYSVSIVQQCKEKYQENIYKKKCGGASQDIIEILSNILGCKVHASRQLNNWFTHGPIFLISQMYTYPTIDQTQNFILVLL